MDEILYLEPDEEITSVIDKMKTAKSARLGLVVPREATLLQSVVNLRLLLREAAALGKEIAIVTSDKIGRNLAAQIGIPVYNSIEEQAPVFQPPPPKPSSEEIIEIDMAQKTEEPQKAPKGVQVHHFQEDSVVWRRNKPPVLKPQAQDKLVSPKISAPKPPKDFSKYKKVFWPILAILVVLLGIATYLLLPKAYVTIFVPSEDLKKQVQLVISSKVSGADTRQNILPGDLVEVSKEAQGNFPATGKKNIGEKASGTITLYNTLDSNNHNLAAGTQLSNSSKTFLLKSQVVIPGAGVSGGSIIPGTVKADIEAENPGEDYNVKAGRFTIMGLSAAEQEKIYGQSTSDLTGGLSKEVQVVSQSDYDQAKQKLVDELQTTLNQDFQAKIKEKKALDKAIVNPDPEVTSTAGVDQEAKEFEMKVKLTKKAMVFSFPDLKAFLSEILEEQVPSDKIVAIPNDNDIGLEVKETAYDKGEMAIAANVTAKIASKVSQDKIKTAILGKSRNEAESFIKGQEGVARVEINFRPSWWFKKIPDLERNVDVRIEYFSE
ncbi:hypothetical protein A2V71_00155 [Candidatus Berkelbacteria bacterium RBG_13_40_8]|uniref:Baseplate protein J-like barrel domain-containing protein n=1 Tax=Candidatus Berkelbacteria bacterium RBG_13_40_8 TaxID=1797467 RepID=A0A1F5DQJ6_9BACT|nr:MAG: hypothetical protein A2V71_00155 [Candidatus Berkelbacteria bacterium RBG_13_40_8]